MADYVLVDKEALQDLVQGFVRRENLKRKTRIISSREAMERLNINRTAFYNLLASEETLLRKAKGKMGILESSVDAEIERLTN